MSGFEVAGVVLAVLPLIGKALESYSAGASAVKTVLYYEQAYDAEKLKFEMAMTTYVASCQRLLSPLPISHEEREQLIWHPTSAKWMKPRLNSELKKRLGPSYDTYLRAMQILHKRLDQLKKGLELDNDYLPPWITRSGNQQIQDSIKRAEFFSRKYWSTVSRRLQLLRCQKIMQKLDKEIETIGGFFNDAIELEAPRREHQAQIDSSHWLAVRDYAQCIFKSLESRLSTPCPCEHFHRASLQLRISNETCQSDFRAKFILSLEKKPGATVVAPWNWRDIDIKPERINLSQRRTCLSPEIGDFCHALKKSSKIGSCIGHLDDNPWKFHIHESVHCHQSYNARTIMSLADIMVKRPQNGVTSKEKIALALKLAVAVLQLHGTSWINSDYGLDYLFFPTNGSTPEIPLFEPAYVSRTFIAANAANIKAPVASEGRRLARNPLLYALGVSLMELTYGQRLPALAISSELDPHGNETPTTEMLVAVRLLKRIRDCELDRYALATASCVQCDLGYPFDYSLDDENFRANFIKRVIIPLKDDYDVIASIR